MPAHQEATPSYLASVFNEMWYLFVLFAAVVVIGVFAYLRQQGPHAETSREVAEGTADSSVQAARPSDTMIMPSSAEQASATIAEHQAKLDADPKSADAPGYLNAMGNLALTRQLDYAAAARYYERLVADYPDFAGIGQAYIQLSTCYEKLGDQRHVQWVYKQMMEKFPEDSQEHLFAKAQLGL